MIGAGGTFMALANISMRQRGEAGGSVAHHELTRSEVRHIADRLRSLPLRTRRAVPGLNPDRADIIIAGILVIERLMKLLHVNRLQVHDRGVRDGLMLRMIAEAFGRKLKPAEESADPLGAVQQFAATCGFEQAHSQHVAKLALQLFDQLQDHLKLPADERLLLEAAAYLHEIGYLINYEKHHQHSYHLILHGNLRGLTPKQRELIANIARYHRKSLPKQKHENFARLNSEEQATVMRMSALLRLADGLERTHMQRVQAVECEWRKKTAIITLVADQLPEVDMWGGKQKGDLFEKAFDTTLDFAWRPAGVKGMRVRSAS
jgi:exopolyphosphatase/guanosine-5'-triphosphate,3'-diphosphate pyrophosphatase